jgi:hypothetical protein
MSIIPNNNINVNVKANAFSLVGKDRATQGCDLSVLTSPPTGERALAFILPSNTSGGGVISAKPNVSNFDGDRHLDDSLDGQGSNSVPTGLDGLDSTNYDNVDITGLCKDFDNYIKDLEGSQKLFAHIKNEGQGLEALIVIDRVSGSRYFPEGRAKIRRKIQKRMKKKKEKGIYLVFTVDTKRYSMIEAWDNIWENFKLWRDAINIYRKRHMNAKENLRYVAVLEQHKSGYPHLNVFFPGLRILVKQADFDKITEWWKMGGPNGVEVERERKPQSVCSYVLKYVSKMEGWTKECFAILWHYRIRLWNMSHSFYDEKIPSGWVLVDIYKSISFEYLLSHFGFEAHNLQDVRFILINSS